MPVKPKQLVLERITVDLRIIGWETDSPWFMDYYGVNTASFGRWS